MNLEFVAPPWCDLPRRLDTDLGGGATADGGLGWAELEAVLATPGDVSLELARFLMA